jgi:hypothetical protein
MEEDEGDKEDPADTSQVVKSDDVTFLKRLEKNLLVLQLGGIQDIKKVLSFTTHYYHIVYCSVCVLDTFSLWSGTTHARCSH